MKDQLVTSLTDTLATPNAQGRPIGGAEITNPLGGLADLTSGLMRAFANSGTSSGREKQNNVALDEAAMGIFQQGTGVSLSDPAKKDMVLAQRLQKARDSDNLDAVTYDVKMTGLYADLMIKYPNEAAELLQYADERGINHHLFRQMNEANQRSEAGVTQSIKMENDLLDYANKNGLDSLRSGAPKDVVMADALNHLATDNANAALKAKYEAAKANLDITKPFFDQELDQLQQQIGDGVLTALNDRGRKFFGTMYDLMQVADNDPEKMKVLDHLWGEGLDGLELFGEEVRGYMADEAIQGTSSEAGGSRPYVVRFNKEARSSFEDALKVKKELFTNMRNKPIEEQKRFFDNLKATGLIESQKLFPGISSLSRTTGLTVNQIITMSLMPQEQGGIDAAAGIALLKEFAAGVNSTLETSAQNIAAATKRLDMPAANSDLKVSVPAVVQAVNMYKVSSNLINQNNFANEGERKAALNTFENNVGQLTYMLNNSMTPNLIDDVSARQALDTMLNVKMFDNIDSYAKVGGDGEYAGMLQSQLAVAASNFSSKIIGDYVEQGRMHYDHNTKFFIANQSKTTLSNYEMVRFGNARAVLIDRERNDENVRSAKLANDYLDYFDKIKDRTEIIPTDILKSTSSNIRDFIGQGLDMPELLKALGDKAAKQLDPTSDDLFKQAVDNLKFDSSLPQEWTDNSPSFSAPSGQFNLTTKAPKEYQDIFETAAKEFGVDPALVLSVAKQESSFNPNAKGPSISKFKGTKDEHALGIMQLLPSTADEMGVDVNNPADNIRGGTKYLAEQMKRFNDDPRLAVMAYNWGPSSVERWLARGSKVGEVPAQTLDYVKRVLGVDLTKEQ